MTADNTRSNIGRVEFWAATAILAFEVFMLITMAISDDWVSDGLSPSQLRNKINYFFVSNLISAVTLYLSFLLLNFRIAPRLVRREAVFLNSVLVLLTMLSIWMVLGATATWLKELITGQVISGAVRDAEYQKRFFESARLILIMGFYTVLKETGLYLFAHAASIQKKYPYLRPDSLTAVVIWAIVLFLVFAMSPDMDFIVAWLVMLPTGILLYSWSFYSLIPTALARKRPFRSYLLRVFLILLVLMVPLFLLGFAISGDDDLAGLVVMFNAIAHLFITAPVTWLIFKRKMRGNEELFLLKKQLGQSHANLNFLRSQINPHFLFNALNTLYGTALQEGAERTGEGIQKLGDMMRFMLQENMQEKISLAREIDYMNNYISLQRLRTDPHPAIRIEAEIAEEVQPVQIAPMLLIPFIENAFKHGISFREPSDVKISLLVREQVLQFDVSNSKHERTENDPEKENNGIGLANVRQRLALIYPGRHELVIRETKKDFFVHLSIKLVP